MAGTSGLLFWHAMYKVFWHAMYKVVFLHGPMTTDSGKCQSTFWKTCAARSFYVIVLLKSMCRPNTAPLRHFSGIVSRVDYSLPEDDYRWSNIWFIDRYHASMLPCWKWRGVPSDKCFCSWLISLLHLFVFMFVSLFVVYCICLELELSWHTIVTRYCGTLWCKEFLSKLKMLKVDQKVFFDSLICNTFKIRFCTLISQVFSPMWFSSNLFLGLINRFISTINNSCD